MEQFDFMAWSLYTGPSNLKNVINNPNCPWVVGTWDGLNADTSAKEIKQDIDARIDLIANAFQTALPSFRTYNRNFVIPEFFFHCKQGPYPNLKVDGTLYPIEYIKSTLKARLQSLIPNDNNYYSIAIGSILTSNIEDYATLLNSSEVTSRLQELNRILASNKLTFQASPIHTWRRTHHPHQPVNAGLKALNDPLTDLNNFMLLCRANPLCTVRNQGIYFHVNKSLMQDMDVFVYEKQYESTVDLTMGIFDEQNKLVHGGMITEWIGNYPSYSILSGDKQTSQYSTNARFTPQFLGFSDVGVEICLDHRLQRLRRTVDMSKANGAAADNYPLFKQVIPSGGMQILDYSVAADRNCAIFNADGCDKIYGTYGVEETVILNGNAGTFNGITCGVYNQSIQSKWTGKDGNTYYSHSQLAFTTNGSSIGGFNNALGLSNVKASTFEGTATAPTNQLTDSYSPQVIAFGKDTDLFACNTGELHYYQPI